MSWVDVAVFSGLTFVIGCCIGNIIELQRKVKELDEIWRLYREGEKINKEMQDEMMGQMEKLEEEYIAQHNMIEMLGGYPEVTE